MDILEKIDNKINYGVDVHETLKNLHETYNTLSNGLAVINELKSLLSTLMTLQKNGDIDHEINDLLNFNEEHGNLVALSKSINTFMIESNIKEVL